jgi:hypothetical protein
MLHNIMAKYIGTTLADGGPDVLRLRAATPGRIVARLLSGYTVGDSYSTVVADSLGSAALAPGDITSAGASGASRVTTIASKTVAIGSNNAGTTLHYAVVDSVSNEVLAVTTATSNTTPLTSGASWASGQVTLTLPQPS